MKNFTIGWVFILAILFSACGAKYGTTISQRLTEQQGHWVLLHPGDQHETLVFDSLYVIDPTFSQKVEITKETGVFGWAIALVVLAAIVIVIAIIYSNGAGKWREAIVAAGVAAIVLCGGAFALIDWAHTKQSYIPKSTYDSLMQTKDGLKPFWDENLLK